MRHAIAIWNYCWNAKELPGWVLEFADHGFDTISFHPKQFAGPSAGHLPAVVETLRERDLRATVHGSCAMERGLFEGLIEAMGDRLLAITLDSAMREDSRGRLHDATRIAGALSDLQRLTAGTTVDLAVEDFPLDALARQYFAAELGQVYEQPRTGILIDVGHMHMRMTGSEYFRPRTVSDYFHGLPCRLVEVHLHDNNGEKDQHGHFGSGSVPFDAVAQALRDLAFDGVCTIEIAPGFHGSTPAESKGRAAESLARWRAVMASKGTKA